MSRLCVLMLLLLALPSYASRSPENVANQYYAWVLSRQPTSLPFADGDLKKLRHILSPRFIRLAAQASTLHNLCVATTATDVKPLILEHDLFLGSDGDATRFAYAKWEQKENLAMVGVDLTRIYKWNKKTHTEKWRDTLILERVSGRWQVRDVLFNESSSSTAMLERYLRDAEGCVYHRPATAQ
jgi:hypothetical protein